MRRPNSLLCVVQYYGNALRPRRGSEASAPRLSLSRQDLGKESVRGSHWGRGLFGTSVSEGLVWGRFPELCIVIDSWSVAISRFPFLTVGRGGLRRAWLTQPSLNAPRRPNRWLTRDASRNWSKPWASEGRWGIRGRWRMTVIVFIYLGLLTQPRERRTRETFSNLSSCRWYFGESPQKLDISISKAPQILMCTRV